MKGAVSFKKNPLQRVGKGKRARLFRTRKSSVNILRKRAFAFWAFLGWSTTSKSADIVPFLEKKREIRLWGFEREAMLQGRSRGLGAGRRVFALPLGGGRIIPSGFHLKIRFCLLLVKGKILAGLLPAIREMR